MSGRSCDMTSGFSSCMNQLRTMDERMTTQRQGSGRRHKLTKISKFIFLKGLGLGSSDRLGPPLAVASPYCCTIRLLCSTVPDNRFLQHS